MERSRRSFAVVAANIVRAIIDLETTGIQRYRVLYIYSLPTGWKLRIVSKVTKKGRNNRWKLKGKTNWTETACIGSERYQWQLQFLFNGIFLPVDTESGWTSLIKSIVPILLLKPCCCCCCCCQTSWSIWTDGMWFAKAIQQTMRINSTAERGTCESSPSPYSSSSLCVLLSFLICQERVVS